MNNKYFIFAVLPLALACSSAVDSGETPSVGGGATNGNLLLSVDVGSGRSVDFYGLPEGAVGITEKGPGGSPSVLDALGLEEASLAETFRALRPGEVVPDVLVKADEAQANSQAGEEVLLADPGIPTNTENVAAAEEVGKIQQAWTSGEFIARGGCLCVGDVEVADCKPNLVSTAYSKQAKVERTRGRFAHESGNGFHLDGFMSNNRVINAEIPAGYWLNFEMTGPRSGLDILDRTFRWTTSQVAGDTYHAGSCFHIY